MNLSRNYIIGIAGGVVLLLVLIIGSYFYFQSQKPKTDPNNPQAAQEEVKKIVEEVGKLIDLPNEEPTVATVTDISKLKDQVFFQKAKNGDKVLIYSNSKKAILYDPLLKKVLDVAPINVGTDSAAQQQPQANPFKLVLRNGSGSVGLTAKVETEIKNSMPQLNIVAKDNAKQTNYEQTLIIVINQAAKDAANTLLNSLKGAKLGDLPQGEEKPTEGDILVILGKDRI